MKVEISEPKKAEKRPFPKLMIGKYRQIVFMASGNDNYGYGFIVNHKEQNKIGFESTKFILEEFEDFEGSITLSND